MPASADRCPSRAVSARNKRGLHAVRMLIIVAWFGWLGAGLLPAQDALRASLAGETAARARKANENIPYNIKIGPASIRFSSSIAANYVDNINVAEVGALDDLILRPEVSVDAYWAVTPQNALNFSIGAGYSKYLNQPTNDNLIIHPNSAISFDVFVGDFKINLHDRFSYVQDPLQNGAVSGTNAAAASFGTSQNAVGVSVDWDLNKILLTVGVDHQDSFSTSSAFSYLDQSSEFFYARPAFLLNPVLTMGLDLAGGISKYNQSGVLNNSHHYSAGPFVNWKVSEYLQLTLRGGYVVYSFDSVGSVTNVAGTNATDSGNPYASLTLDHVLNKFITQSISAEYRVQPGVNSDAQQLLFIRHAARWRILRGTDISTDTYFEHSDEIRSLNALSEIYDRFGISVGASYQLSSKMTTGFGYSYTRKVSNVPTRGYTQNSVTLNLGYRF